MSTPSSIHPLVTVVIPTHNRLALVQEAVISVIAQTYTHWELILVDDGSEDGTSKAIHSLNDSRIRVLEMERVGNIAVLRNTGVRTGSGEWLAFLDSDDMWLPQRLEIQLNRMLKEGKRWGYGKFELMDKEMITIPNKSGIFRPLSGWIAKDVLTTEASVNIGTLLVERTLFEEAGGFNTETDLIYREDYELVLRLALRAEALAVPDLLLRVREHRERATNAFEHGHDRTAFVYEHFLRTHPQKELAKIARLRMASELAESAIKRIQQGKYFQAARKLGLAMINGDKWRHLFSVVRRGFSVSSPPKKVIRVSSL